MKESYSGKSVKISDCRAFSPFNTLPGCRALRRSVSNNRHFFKGSADDLSPLTLSWCHKGTNALVKNLRHGFLVERVKKQMRCLSFSSTH